MRSFTRFVRQQQATFSRRRPCQDRHAPARLRPLIETLEDRVLLALPPVLLPSQVVHAYGVDRINFGGVAGTGAGQTIAIIDPGDDSALVNSTDPNFSSSDLAMFDARTGLADPPSFQVVGETGGARPTYNVANIASATESGNTVTITTTAAHGFAVNEMVTIAGVGVGGYNGPFRITSVTATTFTYTDTSGLAASSGGTATPTNPVESTETALDVEWAHAIAPAANIVLIETTPALFRADIVNAIKTAESAGVNASVVSMSFTFPESGGDTGTSTTLFDDGLFNAAGVAFVASTGDMGEPGGYPAFSPNVLAVGATNLNLNPDGSYLVEKGWSNPPVLTSATESGNVVTIRTATATGLYTGNLITVSGVGVAGYNGQFTVTSILSDTSFTYTDNTTGLADSSGGKVFGSLFTDGNSGGSGGGISTMETPQPPYQQGTVTKVTQSTTYRTIPDVSFVGGSATPVEAYDSFSGGFFPTGGTSLSAPCWAGLIAIADQGLALRGLPPLNSSAAGFPGQTTVQAALYDMNLAFFHDITSGFNGANAGVGYDLVTGIGTPEANLLVPALAGFQPVDVTSPGNQSSVEGAAHTFSLGSYIDYGAGPVNYVVSWGDNTPDLVVNTSTTSASVTADHTYGAEGTYTLKFTVTDVPTGQVACYTITITVSDPAVVAMPVPVFTVEGPTVTTTLASFTDPGGAETLADYAATIDWGDGTTSAGAITYNGSPGSTTGVFTVQGTHRYANEGNFTITVTVHHDAAADVSTATAVTIADPAVLLTAGAAITGTEGQSAASQLAMTFTDPGGAESLAHYAATIDWGDGTTSAGTITYTDSLGSTTGIFTVQGSHLYADEGTFTIAVTVHHDIAPAPTATSTATISDPAVLASGGLVFTGTRGVPSGDEPVATFTDPAGAESPGNYAATIDWGDGTTSRGTITYSGGLNSSPHKGKCRV